MFKSGKTQFLMNYTIQYGKTKIDFTVNKSDRKTLAIEVYPDLSINIIAPKDASVSDIKSKVLKRASWIVKQKEYFESFLPRIPERQYVSGETHYYLGRRYLLKVKNENTNIVKLKAGNIFVFTKNNSQVKVKHLLTKWYYMHSEQRFNEIFNDVFTKFSKYNLKTPQLEIKRMKNRWGSCISDKKIVLNPELIKAPMKSIEYVITHEICHLIYPNHSKVFYQLLSEKMPDWKKWKTKLENLL